MRSAGALPTGKEVRPGRLIDNSICRPLELQNKPPSGSQAGAQGPPETAAAITPGFIQAFQYNQTGLTVVLYSVLFDNHAQTTERPAYLKNK